MAIKEVLELVGSDVVIKQLNDVQKAGEQTLAVFNKPLPELKFPEPDTKPTEDMTGHVVKLKDALHTLKPILQAAGVQIGEFGAFARLASGSVIGLATALGGAVVVGLAKLEENAARTRGKLTDLFGSTAKGDQAFGALEKQAAQFGTTVEGLAPGLESFQTALNAVDRTAKGFVALRAEDLPGAQIAKNADAVSTAYGNFIKLLRAGRLDQDQAEKSAKAFFDTLKDGGTVTSAALKNLPVGTINLLKEALGAAGLSTQAFFAAVDSGSIGIDKLQQSLLSFGPQAEKAFDTKAIKTFSDEIGRLLTTLNKGFAGLTGKAFSDFVIAEISRVRQGVQDSIDELNKVRELIRRGEESSGATAGSDLMGQIVSRLRGVRTSTQGFDEAGFATVGEDAGKAFNEGFLKAGFVFASNSLQQLGAAGVNAGNKIAQGIDQASASIQNLRDKAKETGQALTQDTVIGSTRFTGRLNQIPVFQPQLAGEAGDTAGKAAGKKFVDAVQTTIQEASQTLVEPVKNIIETGLTVPAEAQQTLVQQFTETGTQSAAGIATGFQDGVPQMFGVFQSLYDQIKQLFAQPIPVAFSESGGTGGSLPPLFASGGMVNGPGSTTSDSIMAWLSRGEYVVNARATSAYLPLLQAINAMRLPLNVGQFNMGGLARVLGNRFAGGGVVSSAGTRSLTLVLDQKPFSLTGSKGTIDDLEREASLRGLAMIGKAPSWIR